VAINGVSVVNTKDLGKVLQLLKRSQRPVRIRFRTSEDLADSATYDPERNI